MRPPRSLRLALPVVAMLAGTALVVAHIRLTNPSNGNPLFWQNPGSIAITINAAGSDDIDDGSHFTALRHAIAAWNGAGQTAAQLVEDTNPAQQARVDWGSDDIHLILFDEANSSGFFPGGAGIVAVTAVFFHSNGRIADADVLFNGHGFQFTTSGAPGRFDVADVGTHELGHVLGLDHSGWAGASMYPYVDPSMLLHRSLSLDDVRGLRHAYPAGVFSTITGTVEREDGSRVQGAHVVARDAAGRTAGATLTDDGGHFTLRSLTAGDWIVYATPLDQPVSAGNLSSSLTIETDFESTLLGTVTVDSGANAAAGVVTVGADVDLTLGRAVDIYPLRAESGATTTLLVRGSGLDVTCTLTASDPTILVTPIAWMNAWVRFELTVPAGAAPGHVDLEVESATGDRSILVAGVELTPPDPVVATVIPASGDAMGGTAVTIVGELFEPGLRVVIGDQIYVDGISCSVVDAHTVTLTTNPTIAGLHDVVVIDATGVEGRLPDGFRATVQPSLETVFPVSGAAAGGTTVILTGADFVAGSIVTIDGVVQANVTVDGPNQLTVVTAPALPGLELIAVENPSGLTAIAAYTYVDQADPVVVGVTPGVGSVAGGQMVTVTGRHFTPDSEVVFGPDPATGAGGAPAALVMFVDTRTLEVVTPTHGSGSTAVMVRESDTFQATVLSGAFIYQGSADDDGGGGGCHTEIVTGPPTVRRVLSGAGWMLVAFLCLAWGSRRRPTAVRA